MFTYNSIILLLSRICISGLFIFSAIIKIIDYDAITENIALKGIIMTPLFYYSVIFVELVGGLSLLLGCATRIGAALLLLFLVPVTYIFQDFWLFEGADRQTQMLLFAKNLAVFGGLLAILASGAGGCSMDAVLWPKNGKP